MNRLGLPPFNVLTTSLSWLIFFNTRHQDCPTSTGPHSLPLPQGHHYLCDPTGAYIPHGMLTGDWQAGSNLLWPCQPKPPRSYFGTFHRCLLRMFCTEMPLDFNYKVSMDLDICLGPWLPVPWVTWIPVYWTQSELFWGKKDDTELFVLVKSPVSGFYPYNRTITTLPLKSHPITYQQIGNDLWTQLPYRIAPPTDSAALLAGHLVSNTLTSPYSEILTIGCDGSVYLDREVAPCARIIAEDKDHVASACFLLSTISSISSSRSELEGMHRSLVHVRQQERG